MAPNYKEKINFIERIDVALNRLEKPLEAIFYYGYTPSDVRDQQSIKKSLPQQPGHLHIQLGAKEYSAKYSTIAYNKEVGYHERGDFTNPTETYENRAYLKLPLGIAEYKKTWGNCDFVLVEWNNPAEKETTVLYWIDAAGLLNFIERMKEPQMMPALDENGNSYDKMFCKAMLDVGVDIETDLQDQLNLVRQINVIDWKKKRVFTSKKGFTPAKHDKEGFDFAFYKDPKMSKPHWDGFSLRGKYLDQSKPLRVFNIADMAQAWGFPSAKVAAEALSRTYGVIIAPTQITMLLKGKQKTIKIPGGRISAQYTNEKGKLV